jgi:hypothetical protein
MIGVTFLKTLFAPRLKISEATFYSVLKKNQSRVNRDLQNTAGKSTRLYQKPSIRRIREVRMYQLGLQLGLRYNYKTFYGSHNSGPIKASGNQKCWLLKHVGFLHLGEGLTFMQQSVECFCEETLFKVEL